MSFNISPIIYLFVCCVAANASAPDSLRLVNVLYRHGDRSPVDIYPNDPFKADIWPQGLGWLTQIGMRQQFALGQFLRSEYDNFLNSTYKNTEIVVQASDENRCLMSAYCNLAGLYPPVKSQQWDENLLWQPIPVHTVPEIEDNKLALEKPCKRYDELYYKEIHGPVVQEEEKVNAAFYQLLDHATGVKRENISVVWEVADTLFVENAHNLTLPEWTQGKWKNGTVYSKLMELRDFSFELLFNGTQLSRLKGGPLLKEFIYNFMNATSGTGEEYHKLYMYSAHDTTVAAVLDAMNVYNQRAPPYASAVLVELHEVEGHYCVKMRYRNSTAVPPHTLQHPKCQQDCCPLNKFVEVTRSRVPVDWEAECDNPVTSSSHDDELLSGTILALTVLFIVLVILFILLCTSYLRQKRVVKTFENI